MQLRRLWVALGATCALAFVGAQAAEGDYTRVAEYFRAYVAPTQGGASGYSGGCDYYIVNEADWPGANYARVTYIDTSGKLALHGEVDVEPARRRAHSEPIECTRAHEGVLPERFERDRVPA